MSSSDSGSYLPSLHSRINVPDSMHSVLCQRPTSTLKPYTCGEPAEGEGLLSSSQDWGFSL
ncbi:MAG: hypothetical protein KBS94_04880 [Prevotella sp.]|nr:hypothetical protein [Candidatus Equicola faecalis]